MEEVIAILQRVRVQVVEGLVLLDTREAKWYKWIPKSGTKRKFEFWKNATDDLSRIT